MRITSKMVEGSVLRNLNSSMERMSKYQNQLSTGKQFSSPSDDPIGVAQTLSLKAVLKDMEQYDKNIGDALAWMNIADSSLGNVGDTLQKAREIAVQGANGSLSQFDRDILAGEVEQLLEELVSAANSSYGGRYIFGGFRTTTEPFTSVGSPITAVNYNGDNGNILYETEKGISIAVNVPGSDAFQGATNVFQSLIDLRDNLLAGDAAAVSNDIGAVDASFDQVLNSRSVIGARINRLEASRERMIDRSLNFSKLLAETEGADMAEVIMNLTMEENVYRAALSSGARIIQPSLLDFIR